jgi:hypothetical protein
MKPRRSWWLFEDLYGGIPIMQAVPMTARPAAEGAGVREPGSGRVSYTAPAELVEWSASPAAWIFPSAVGKAQT